MTVYVFPGQGSQALKMGEQQFNRHTNLVKKANDILGYDLVELCQNGPLSKLSQTEYTQPAIYTVNALMYLDIDTMPSYSIGHSLGEYSALFSAGVFDFETGLKLVKKRGELMSTITGYGMAAVIGLSQDQVTHCIQSNQFDSIDLANLNSPTQFVISGPKDDILKSIDTFKQSGAKMVIPLPVSGAFHSRYMVEIQQHFKDFIGDFEFHPPKFDVIANCNVAPYSQGNVIENLTKQLTSPVRWIETVQLLHAKGETEFKEVGPGKKLTPLVQQCLAGIS